MNLEDLGPALTELFAVREKWFNIGLQLSVPVKELQKIFSEHKNDHSTGLRMMLIKWLEMGEASWKALCRALSSQIVEESALAKKLQQKYCSRTGLTGQKRPSTSKGTKRAQSEDSSAPNAKRPKTELPSSFAPDNFLRPQPSNRLCAKCRRVPRTPLRPECCSHKVYCEPCSQKTKMCLTHRQDIKYTTDKELQASVRKVQIYCPNRQRGCEFKDVLHKVYREHVPTCTKQRKGSRPHNIAIPSLEKAGVRERSGTPTTPSTPLSTPVTPTSMNPPSPMLSQLKSLTSGSLPGSPIATQPPVSPREIPKQAYQPTKKEIFTTCTESLASSQMKILSPVIVSSTCSVSRELSAATPHIAMTTTSTASRTQHTHITTIAGMPTPPTNVARQQAIPTKVSQTSAKPSPAVKSTSSSEPTQSRNVSSASTVTSPQAAKPIISNSLSVAALTRSPLRRQQTSSTMNQLTSSTKDSAISHTLTNQPPKSVPIQQKFSASSKQTSSTADSVVSQTLTKQPPKSGQTQPTASVSFLMPTASVGQARSTQQSVTTVPAMQLQKASTSQAHLQQIQPVMSPIVGISYQPAVQQALSMMGLPMYNSPLILQHANLQSPTSISYSTAGAQTTPVSMQGATKQPETHKVVDTKVTTKVATPSKPQQSITAASSSRNSSQNVTTTGGGTELQQLLKNQAASNQQSATNSNLTTSTSYKSAFNLVTQKTPSKQHTSSEQTKSSLQVSASNSPAQKVIDLTETTPPSKLASTPTKVAGGGRTASKQAVQPLRYKNSTPTTSGSSGNFQTVTSSPKSTTSHTPQMSMSAKKALTFSGGATTTSTGALQTTPTSFSSKSVVQNAPVSSKCAAPKLMAKAEESTSTSNLTITLNNGQKCVINTQQSLLCTVCQRTPRNPLRSECCGVLYCELCSRRIEKCPQHKCHLKLKRDTELFNVIQKQQTKCKYAGNGCTWIGLVADQRQHIMVCIYNPSTKEDKASGSVSVKVGEAGTNSAKKRPSDASAPSAVKKPKSSVKLPENFQDDDFLRLQPADRLCIKCDRVPFNPQRSECCNRLYCEPCSKRNKKCRKHKEPLQYISDRELYSKIQKLKIKCPNRKEGCDWTGSIFNLKNHLPTCDAITFQSTAKTRTTSKVASITLPPPLPKQQQQSTTMQQSLLTQPPRYIAARHSYDRFQQPLIQYRDMPKMDLLYLIKYTSPDGRECTLKLVDKLAPFWKRMGSLLGINIQQLTTWELTYANPSNCSEAVLSYFLSKGSQGTYVYPRTWGGIVKLLLDLDLKAIAEEIQSIAR